MDRNRVLKSTSGHPVFRIFEESEDFNLAKLMKFYNNLETLLKQKIPYGDVGSALKICVVLIDKAHTGDWNLFKEIILVNKLKKGDLKKNNVIFTNCNGEIVKIDGRKVNNIVDSSSFSKKMGKIPTIFIENRKVYFLVDGRVIYFIPDIISDKRIGIVTDKGLPAREYRKLIENHYKDKIEGERGFKYWKNKNERLLISPPEIIFHKPLWSYLNDNVLDGRVDSGVDLGGTSDRSDIRIISFNESELGKSYIIEIKCLGRCKKEHSEKGDKWANQGILQLKSYLNEEKNPKVGLLIVYDGRKNNQEINWIPKENWHMKTDPNPIRFYLISEPASVRAKKGLKNIKVENG
ncbi:MAG: hypothetical protein ACOC5T_00630 [Elusimicrobiota bacterium]